MGPIFKNVTMKDNYTVPYVNTSCRGRKSVSVSISAYLKKVWCSMQTFHNRFEARWLGSLKPMVLSNCSYLAVGGGGEEEEEEGRWRRKGEWREQAQGKMVEWWQGELCLLRSNGKINIVFLFTGRNICLYFPLPCQVDFPSLTNLKISCSCAHCIRCSVMWTEKDAFESIGY